MIKTWLKGAKEIWSDELPSVLWAYQMIACMPIGKTSFRLAFGSEDVILAEIGLTSYRVAHHDEERNEEGMSLHTTTKTFLTIMLLNVFVGSSSEHILLLTFCC